MIRRVVVTGDALRPAPHAFRSAQADNLHWFHRLLRGQIAAATGLPVERVGWGEGLDTPALYALWGAETSLAGWAALHDAPGAPEGVVSAHARAFEDALVVGFEMAEVTKRILDHLGVPWLDLSIHPIRFLHDVFFAVETRQPEVFSALLPRHAEAPAFLAAAGLIAASAAKFLPALRPEAPRLLLGQTRADRSLIRGGRILDLSAFPAEVRALSEAPGGLSFKPHPYEEGDFGLLALGLPYRSWRLVRANAYALMATGEVEEVVGLSSSLLAEAPHFGCAARALLPPLHRLPARRAEAEPGMHLGVVEGPLDADFWREILAPLLPTTSPDGQRLGPVPNALRSSLRNFWGYNQLTTDAIVEVRGR